MEEVWLEQAFRGPERQPRAFSQAGLRGSVWSCPAEPAPSSQEPGPVAAPSAQRRARTSRALGPPLLRLLEAGLSARGRGPRDGCSFSDLFTGASSVRSRSGRGPWRDALGPLPNPGKSVTCFGLGCRPALAELALGVFCTLLGGWRHLPWLRRQRSSLSRPTLGREQAWLSLPAEERRKSKAKPNGKKPAPEEKKLYLEPEYAKSRITDFEFKELVTLPREIDLNEWLASNTTTFFHHVNLQYSTISEFCTGDTCQTMAVGSTQYYWYDERGKKTKCTAPQYVDFVMSSVQKLVTDEDVFPTKYGKEFPNSFEALVKKICRYLFHVLAHIYAAHFKETLALELHGHLNTLYTHFILFIREFNLVDSKEVTVMDDLTEALCSGGGGDGSGGGGGAAQNHVKER
uniref:MOB kinase activator 2 n=1 Tax=Monodelphis domestica TaxID=13616 RepID=H9H6H4_MONDO